MSQGVAVTQLGKSRFLPAYTYATNSLNLNARLLVSHVNFKIPVTNLSALILPPNPTGQNTQDDPLCGGENDSVRTFIKRCQSSRRRSAERCILSFI